MFKNCDKIVIELILRLPQPSKVIFIYYIVAAISLLNAHEPLSSWEWWRWEIFSKID